MLSVALLQPRLSRVAGLAVPWPGHTLCLCDGRRGPGAGREGGCLEQQGFGQLCTLCPACLHGCASAGDAREDSSPALAWDASGSRNKSHPFYQGVLSAFCSTSLLLQLVEAACPWPGSCLCVEEGEKLQGGFCSGICSLSGKGQVPRFSCRVHISAPTVQLMMQSLCLKTGSVFWPGCVGEEIYNCFPPFPLLTSSCCIHICGTIALDCKESFNFLLRRGKRKSQGKPSLGLAE